MICYGLRMDGITEQARRSHEAFEVSDFLSKYINLINILCTRSD